MSEEMMAKIYEKLDRQADQTSLLRETVGIMSNQITDLHHCIKGNGKPGLIEEHALLKESFCDHKHADFKIRLVYGVGLVAVMTGSATGGALFFELLKKLAGL